MRVIYGLVPLVLAACVTPASTQDLAATQNVAPLYVRHAMQTEVNPAIVAIWDVSNNALNENGEFDASLMTSESWDALASAAGNLAAASETMAQASDIRAAAPGNLATDEYEVPMPQVQAYIDADPQLFRDLSASFAALARNLETSAQARTADFAGLQVASLDVHCATCHEQFWYPEAQ